MANKSSDGGVTANSERNRLQQAKPRERQRTPSNTDERAKGAPVNSIREVAVRTAYREASPEARREAQPPRASSTSRPAEEERAKAAQQGGKEREEKEATDPHPIPDHIRRRFVQVGRKYYFPDGARAFTDRGHRLSTASENTEVIKSLVEIAKERGWAEISVHGTERFRREAWMSARMAGLEVRGYRPNEFEEKKLVRAIAEKTSPKRRAAPLPSPNARETAEGVNAKFVGKLLEHGRAPYRQDPKEQMSYFVRLDTAHGERTIWGVDLERAFKESLTHPTTGDQVVLIPARRDAVKANVAERDADGKVSGQKSLEAHRNRWVVEKESFVQERHRAAQAFLDPSVTPKQGVKDHPELVGTYLQAKAAELASKKLKNPADRAQFMDRVKNALAEAVARGEPLPTVKFRERAPVRRPARAPDQAQAR